MHKIGKKRKFWCDTIFIFAVINSRGGYKFLCEDYVKIVEIFTKYTMFYIFLFNK